MTESNAAESITKVFVQASGRKRRPACPVSVNTGRKPAAMMSSEKKMAGVTSRAASPSSRFRSAPGGAPASFLCDASIITISASTVAPMAMAMPPRLMMVAGMSNSTMGMKESATAMGMEMMGRSAERKWKRKTITTSATTMASSTRAFLSVAIDRSISPVRSYATSTFTPAGSERASSAIFCFTRPITSSTFSPWRTITMPPTASPSPFHSSRPRRMSGPKRTVATSFTKIGAPSGPRVRRAVRSMAPRSWMYPRPCT